MRGLVVGTGPSLRSVLHLLPRFDGRLFICNNCWSEPWVLEHYERHGIPAVHLACDPAWHSHFGPLSLPDYIEGWHWDRDICSASNLRLVEGIWHESKTGPMRLWLKDKTKITLGHCSSVQLLNLAANQYGCTEIVLIGHDFSYRQGRPRHYFTGLSDVDGEYPAALRKQSAFDKGAGQYDLIDVYHELARTEGIPPVWNATVGSALSAFPYRPLEDFLK